MKLDSIKNILKAEVVHGEKSLNKEIKCACASDLMSDILAFNKAESLLLTGLVNAHVIRTAEIVEVIAVCFVRGKQPQEEVIALARKKNIPLLTTPLTMYECCGRLYQSGLPA